MNNKQIARFFAKTIPEPNSGCLLWLGSHNWQGYGMVCVKTVGCGMSYAHRIAWLMRHGPIPDGLFVCHTCDVRCCVNPDHLYLGTHADNMRDMARRKRTAAGRRTHCPQGHAYDPANTAPTGRGGVGRYCKECVRVRSREWMRRRAATG